jgi:hypothetical protein
MAGLQRWCRVDVVNAEGAVLARYALEGPRGPDLRAVDDVARLALLAARLGGGITLAQVCPRMRELLELTGLRVEVEGQAELGEEPLCVQERQEEIHPGDLPS